MTGDPRLADLSRRIDAAFARNGTSDIDRVIRRAGMFVNERRCLPDGSVVLERMDLNEFYRREAWEKVK